MLRKLIFTLLAVVIAGSVWVSAVAASQAQGLQSDGCNTLNTLVPDPQTEQYAYLFAVYELDFLPGETIHASITVEGDAPETLAQIFVIASDYSLLAMDEQIFSGLGTATATVDYVAVDGDDGVIILFLGYGYEDEYFSVSSVNLSCTPANTPPVANDDSYSTAEDGLLNVAAPGVLGNDNDGESDLLSAVLVSGPSNGSLTLNADGSFSYTPAANFSGSDSFTYKANDGQADSNVATVNITVVSAADQIAQLAADVQALVDSGALSAGDANKLFHDLDQAQKHLDKGQAQPTLNMLDKFIKDVDKLIDKGDLPAAQGQPLIDAANAIINSLN